MCRPLFSTLIYLSMWSISVACYLNSLPSLISSPCCATCNPSFALPSTSISTSFCLLLFMRLVDTLCNIMDFVSLELLENLDFLLILYSELSRFYNFWRPPFWSLRVVMESAFEQRRFRWNILSILSFPGFINYITNYLLSYISPVCLNFKQYQ